MTAAAAPDDRERAWLLVCSVALVCFAALTAVAVVDAGDPIAIGFTAALLCSAYAVGRARVRLRHLPWVWLITNAYGAAMWKDLRDLPGPLLAVVNVLWVLAALGLLMVPWVSPAASRSFKVVATLVVVAGAALHAMQPRLGACAWVWRHEASLLAQATAELSQDFEARMSRMRTWHSRSEQAVRPRRIFAAADTRDHPPVRAAFPGWVEGRYGEIYGIVYDPSGAVLDPTRARSYGTRTWHLFGPWYLFEH